MATVVATITLVGEMRRGVSSDIDRTLTLGKDQTLESITETSFATIVLKKMASTLSCAGDSLKCGYFAVKFSLAELPAGIRLNLRILGESNSEKLRRPSRHPAV